MGVVYKITNSVNGKIYVGKTIGPLGKRFSAHKDYAKHNHADTYLYRAMRKHGCENFRIEVIDTALLDETLCDLEMKWIAELKATDRRIGYNGTFGGQSGVPTPAVREKMKGRPCSPETRAKISAAQIGKVIPRDVVERQAAARRGVPVSPERAAAMKANPPGAGTKRTEEQRKRMSEAIKASYTPERCAAMSARRKARHAQKPIPAPLLTAEGRAKVAAATRRRWQEMSIEEREALGNRWSEFRKGKKQSSETVAKRVAATRRSWTPEKRAAWGEKLRDRLIEMNRRRSEAAQQRRAA